MPAAVEAQAELADEFFIQTLYIPLIRMKIFGCELIEGAAEDSAHVVFEDELALFDTLEKLTAQSINSFALFVHHVVIFEQVFAGLEVLRFNGFLRCLDAVRDHARFDGHAFFHAEALKQRADPLLGEDAHEVVFEREIKARCAGIALTAGTAAELIVDAAGLVALSAENEQASGGDDFFVFLLRGLVVDVERLVPVGSERLRTPGPGSKSAGSREAPWG